MQKAPNILALLTVSAARNDTEPNPCLRVSHVRDPRQPNLPLSQPHGTNGYLGYHLLVIPQPKIINVRPVIPGSRDKKPSRPAIRQRAPMRWAGNGQVFAGDLSNACPQTLWERGSTSYPSPHASTWLCEPLPESRSDSNRISRAQSGLLEKSTPSRFP